MAHDVFISYSSNDKPQADAICARLEAREIRCWMAPRDVLPGSDYAESIVDAIESSRALVVVFSANANTSAHLKKEVERAVNKAVPIVPVRIEDVKPSKSMEYFISSQHWLDALTPPLEEHIDRLVTALRALLDRPEIAAVDASGVARLPAEETLAAEAPTPPPDPGSEKSARRLPVAAIVGAAVVVVALVAYFLLGRGDSQPGPVAGDEPGVATETADPAPTAATPTPPDRRRPAAGAGDNLARGKPAKQSENYRPNQGLARAAVDGNTSGQWGEGSVTHTSDAADPWWEVDLGASYAIRRVEIWNREDCCEDRLDNITILVKGSTVDRGASFSGSPFGYRDLDADGHISIEGNEIGRIVRVQKTGPGPLSLAEVKVYGEPAAAAAPTNVARGRPAIQSENWNPVQGLARNAVDGNTSGQWGAGSVTHTSDAANPWWEVDLGESYAIRRIEIWNRTDDCCVDRLDNITILVKSSANDRGERFTESPIGYRDLDANGHIRLEGDKIGRIVRVQKTGPGPLSLAEVEVYGVSTSR